MKAFLMAGGLGERLRPLTNTIPKPMIEVAGRPVLEHLVDHLNNYGVRDIMIKVHYLPEKIMQHFGDRVVYYYERDLLSQEESEKRLKPWLGREYFVMNGDTLTDINLQAMRNEGCSVESWDRVYTGTKYVLEGTKSFPKNFGCTWHDIGSFEGLEKARNFYANKTP